MCPLYVHCWQSIAPFSSRTSPKAHRKLHLHPVSLTCLYPFEENRNGWLSWPPACVSWHCSLHYRREDEMRDEWYFKRWWFTPPRRRCQTWFLSPNSPEEYLSLFFFLTRFWCFIWRCNSNVKCKNLYYTRSSGWSHGLYNVCSFDFAFHHTVFNQSLILFALCFLITWHMKSIYIHIYSIRPIRCFLSLRYYFMYRSICNTV